MSDGAEYLKYVTERIVSYWEAPPSPEARRERRLKREPWAFRWFGQLLPAGIGIWWRSRRQHAGRTDTAETLSYGEGQADYS
ncbi:YqzE family protein [Cohnella sp. CFH 77786]|uniref:YqzE family protein n=1 Tax=Cohnella sp. CFH 77786 TaxID=2662265 RepID=UPI001C60AEDA|nr:YqzE family protein [Cohnella sp. CFH 77786]MBW5445143.1 YqzE family protein [Cohnella sp. CFH 77786]